MFGRFEIAIVFLLATNTRSDSVTEMTAISALGEKLPFVLVFEAGNIQWSRKGKAIPAPHEPDISAMESYAIYAEFFGAIAIYMEQCCPPG